MAGLVFHQLKQSTSTVDNHDVSSLHVNRYSCMAPDSCFRSNWKRWPNPQFGLDLSGHGSNLYAKGL
jgi:hypothetical protein